MTTQDLVLQILFLVLGVGLGVTLLVLQVRGKNELGCLGILLGLLALTLVVGGIAGPAAAAELWG
jgi:hypothetical protein